MCGLPPFRLRENGALTLDVRAGRLSAMPPVSLANALTK
jgi:hypothetical protein